MTILRPLVYLAALLIGFGGCTQFGGNKTANTPAKQREALEVPPDLTRPAGDNFAVVPAAEVATYSDYTAKTPVAKASPATLAVGTAPTSAAVRLERDGAQRWLVVQDDPARAWVKAREYFLRSNTALVVDDAKTGVLESDWINRPVKFTSTLGNIMAALHSTGLRDKFRVRVEHGRVDGTAEVYVSHQGQMEVVTNSDPTSATYITWQPSPADPELEAEMLGKLLTHFGLDADQAKGQVASASAERAQRVKDALLLPQDDLDAAWRRVGQALDRVGVLTEDRDRNAGIFYVRYVSSQPSKDKGLFSWLTGDSSTASDTKSDVTKDRFQVRLKTLDAGIQVMVLDVKGEPELSTTGQQLLDVLQQQLR